MQTLTIEEFLQSRTAATGPLAAWHKLRWLEKHLRAPIQMEDVPRPPQKVLTDAPIKEVEQAPALLPVHLFQLEHVLAGMIRGGAWEAIVLCVALTLAYSVMRFVHVQRSCLTHIGELVVWARA